MHEPRPWHRLYGSVPPSLAYPRVSLYGAVAASARRHPDAVAYDFLGRTATYRELLAEIDRCADGLAALGLGPGDRLTISMPTSPQGVIAFYAVNKLGAVASLIHPLSPAKEIEFYLRASRSTFALTLDAFYGAFRQATARAPLRRLVLARIPDYLPPVKRLGFRLTKGRKIPPVPADPGVTWWRDLMAGPAPAAPPAAVAADDPAVILYSGGTTGKPKGIVLSNLNFVSEGQMVSAWAGLGPGDRMLAILPIFHGFGLGVCVNAVLMGGAQTILVPQFTAESVAKLVRAKRPTLLVGVPTLFDALSRNPDFARSDLGCLRATFSGADTLPRVVKEAFEAAVRRRGGTVQLLEGYGLTEAVTAVMAMPLGEYREGSVGVPFPDMLAKVVGIGTEEELPLGEEGEICLCGPAVMLGYLDEPEETAAALRRHADGRVWLHTGDLARQDADGFFYFAQRLKRMIKSSGMNVYPAQVEAVLLAHPQVDQACVIGVPDRAQVERVKAFVVPKPGARPGPELVAALTAHCQEHLIKWCCPREVEFRADLPKTLIGKVAFNTLAEEEKARLRAAGEYAGEG
ncbi:MAG: AMP-binding protein [Deferrisomatales bacterium]